jgi:predicted MPP superfamily phosphohydrolase
MAAGKGVTWVGWERTARGLLTATAAFGVWAFLVNRWIINWVDSSAKRFTIFGVALVLGALAFVPVLRRSRGPWVRLAAFVIVAFTLGELRRAWLRHQYAVEVAGGAPIELFHPVTTTDLVVRHFEVPLAGLDVPRLRVLAATDLHVTEELPAAYYARVTREMAAHEPDLLLFTGDYLSRIGRLPLLEEFLRGVPRARYGNYAVLGNHDLWLRDARIARAFERAGITVLSAACATVALPASRGVRVCGTEAPWGPALDADSVARDAPTGTPLLVMSHTPDNVYDLAALGAQAVFAGHTHGGQMRLPLAGAVIIPSVYGRRFDLGHFKVDGADLFVSAGVGADHPALRIYCNPDLVEVDFTGARP